MICIFAIIFSSAVSVVGAGESESEEEYVEEDYVEEKSTYSEIESIQFEGETITSESSECTVIEGEKYKITIISEERYTVEKISLTYDREVFEEYKSAEYSGDKCYKYLKVKDGVEPGKEGIKVRMLDDKGRSIDSEEIKCRVEGKEEEYRDKDKYDEEDRYDKYNKYDKDYGKYEEKEDDYGEDYSAVSISIKSPGDTEKYRKVSFIADTGLDRKEERKRLKFHWTVEGDNLKKEKYLHRNRATAQLGSGDYCVRLKVTDKWTGEEYEDEKYFSVEYSDKSKKDKYKKNR